MERLAFKCLLSTGLTELQLDLKKMPGENGPCYMVSENGLFKGYINKQKGLYKAIGNCDLTENDLITIGEQINF